MKLPRQKWPETVAFAEMTLRVGRVAMQSLADVSLELFRGGPEATLERLHAPERNVPEPLST